MGVGAWTVTSQIGKGSGKLDMIAESNCGLLNWLLSCIDKTQPALIKN